MIFEVLRTAGGLGLFLIGMLIMTEGLRGLAGDALQRTLRRFTRSPATGAGAGTLATMVVQSSSATTVTAIGFAGAGLLSFPSALGIVFGANLGTTFTGWMVVLLGFKVDLGLLVPPVILAGALLRLFARGRLGAVGYALAGFGLVFLGIDGLREGMAGLDRWVTPAVFPTDSLWGRLQLVGIGMAVTIVTQSSSAGVAAALAAVSAGAISFPQAAAIVIGMDVGTTATAALATLGASLPGRRTGWAHVIFNVLTGAVAFAILPLFIRGLDALAPGATSQEPEVSLVAFHSFFNALSVVAVLPLSRPFASLVERLVPERAAPFTERLDKRLLREPAVALRAVSPTLDDLARQAFDVLADQLHDGDADDHAEQRALLTLAVDAVRAWLVRIESPRLGPDAQVREATALHAIDELQRLIDREGQIRRAAAARETDELQGNVAELRAALAAPVATRLGDLAARISADRAAYRTQTLDRAARDELDTADALARLDAQRWLERVTHHAWRIAHHLEQLRREAPLLPETEPPEPD